MRANNSSKSRDKNYKLVNRYFGSSEAYIFRYIFDSAQRHAYMRYIKNAIASEKKKIYSHLLSMKTEVVILCLLEKYLKNSI